MARQRSEPMPRGTNEYTDATRTKTGLAMNYILAQLVLVRGGPRCTRPIIALIVALVYKKAQRNMQCRDEGLVSERKKKRYVSGSFRASQVINLCITWVHASVPLIRQK